MKRTIAQRVNDYLVEPPDAQFVNNKWKFWFIAVAFLSVINAGLTWLIFRDDAENYTGPVMLSVGALTGWLCVCALHYSDSSNRPLARSVSAVDSFALLFVVIHFGGLLYVYGHHRTLRAAEVRYEQAAVAYNVKAEKLSTDNVAIAQAAQTIAVENRKRARLENDTTYQQRRIIEAGGVPRRRATEIISAASPALSTSVVELEKPQKPTESSAAFLTKWDWLIRAANCGELLLACLTLILIRNVSAKTNSPVEILGNSLPIFSTGVYRSPVPAPVGNLTKKKDITKTYMSFNSEGLKRLREALKDISFRLHKLSFKVDVQDDIVWIRMMKARHGTQETVSTAKAKLSLLDDAVKMERTAFRERLENFLRQNEFEI